MKKILLAALLGLSVSTSAMAVMPGMHPPYQQALSDLRAARWYLAHGPKGFAISNNENAAIRQIDHAINDITQATLNDGKNINFHPPVDVPRNRPGQLGEAKEILQRVRVEVAQEEDDPAARGLQHRSLVHIDAALGATQQAILAVQGRY